MSTKSTLSVRIPEEKHRYIRLKALHTGVSQQEFMTAMIDQYQQKDTEYMQKFAELMHPKSNDKESSHGA